MMTSRWLDGCWKLGLIGIVGWGGAVGCADTTIAQVVADPSLGTTITQNGTRFRITGGTTVGGRNLFHSFARFDVPNGGIADFVNAATIANILARVTGGTPSDIQGTANLFLMNPSGIVFGPNAQLNVGGSFVATTANALLFPGGVEFSVSSPVDVQNPLLSVDPSAFLFNQMNAASIQNSSRANAGLDPSNSFSTFGLRVPDGQSLLLLGGDVAIDGGGIVAFGGRIDIGSVAGAGIVGLLQDHSGFRLEFPDGMARSNITLTNSAGFIVAAGGGGSVALTGQTVNILNGSSIDAGMLGGVGTNGSTAGDITIDATESLNILGQGSRINNDVNVDASGSSGNINIKAGSIFINTEGTAISTNMSGSGTSGNINIATQQLVVQNSQVSASVFGSGSAGNLLIQASDSVELSGEIPGGTELLGFPRGLMAQVDLTGTGHGGNLTIETRHLSVSDGSKVQVATFGNGDAGNLSIRADTVDVFETATPNYFSTAINAGISQDPRNATPPKGNGGNLTIVTGRLSINGGEVSVDTNGEGRAGQLLIQARDLVEVVGTSADIGSSSFLSADVLRQATGQGGNLVIQTDHLSIRNGGQVTADTYGEGDAGRLLVQARGTVDVIGAASDGTQSFLGAGVQQGAKGQGGSLTVQADSLNVENSGRVAVDTRGTGKAGDLLIEVKNLKVDASQVSASTFSNGDAGNLIVRASNSVELSGQGDDSPGGLFSQVELTGVGRGGNLTLETKRLDVSDGSKVQVATFGQGPAGNLLIRAEEINVFNTARYGGYSTTIDAGISLDPNTVVPPSGNGGNIFIETDRLNLRNGGRVGSSTEGIGNAGSVFIHARDAIEVVGVEPVFGQRSRIVAVTTENAQGNGGDITIETNRLSIRDGGLISASTFGVGNAGVLRIHAPGSIAVVGQSSGGEQSELTAAVTPGGTGRGGRIELETGQLSIRDGGRITSRSEGPQSAGDIDIRVAGKLEARDGEISTNSTQAGGGTITIAAGNIRLYDDSDIRTDVTRGGGGGGDITLTARAILAFNDSDILAFARDGKGGNITLNTPAFFGQNYRPAPFGTDPDTLDGNSRVDVNASGTVSGIITLPDTSFIQNGLTQLSQNLVDTNTLLANSCIVRSRQQGSSFLITGSGGLSIRPGDAPIAPYPTGTVRSVPEQQDPGTPERSHQQQAPEQRAWKIGDPIVEPQGVYQLPNGHLVMSRECP